MFDAFIPWRFDAMSCVCINTKTKPSIGTDRWFNSRNGEIGKSGGMLTKAEREGKLKDYQVSVGPGKT